MTQLPRPEYYERAPDGAQWPGTLSGLLAALDDSTLRSLQSDERYTLLAVREGRAQEFRQFVHGDEIVVTPEDEP